ncbi:kinetochore protein NUF2 homolog isoform X1 [Mercurialis annua]|uniref:kinetochore protein NUF2 homolog isoform X1 n=2 Tax=Mercurialis annua TaxID=3986 RepID=UPI00215E7384|nr:kinetochore protein NUF2 homolog isoform X1 [Mercurialis annua]
MSKFDYPRLSKPQIISILAESEIAAVTENDLKNPKMEIVSDLYTRLLIHLDLLNEDDQGQVEFAALEQLENPDHHTDSVRVMTLFVRIKEMTSLVRCPLKFTLKDLLRPEGDRLELYLSAILNFCLHKDTKMNVLRPLGEELTLLDEQRKEWEDKISQLNVEIAEHNAAREIDLPQVQELDAKVKELRQTVSELNNHQSSLRAVSRKLKEKAAELDREISKAEFDLVQSVQENANLRSKIVQSPDKLQRALEEKKLVREEVKNAERLAMQSFQEKSAILEVYTKTLTKMTKHFNQMQEIQEQVNSAKSIEKDHKELKAKLSNDSMLDKKLDAVLADRQAKARQLDESRMALEKERDSKCEDATKEFNNVKSEVESRRGDLEARQRKVEAVLSEVDAITQKTNSVKESGAAKVQELVGKGEEIVEQFEKYRNSMGLALQSGGSQDSGSI